MNRILILSLLAAALVLADLQPSAAQACFLSRRCRRRTYVTTPAVYDYVVYIRQPNGTATFDSFHASYREAADRIQAIHRDTPKLAPFYVGYPRPASAKA